MKTNLKITPEIQAMLRAAPEFTEEEAGVRPGAFIARGFAAYKQYINRNGRPKAADPKVLVPIRMPSSFVAGLRATGRGWQTRVSDYLTRSIKSGAFGDVQITEAA